MKYMVREPESGEELFFPSRIDAIRFVENAIRFDIENGIVGSVWSITQVEED